MTERLILSGFGGQGVLSAGIMLGEAAVLGGLQATFFPSYGAEMRGGTANCNVIIADGPIGSPVISTADVLIALNQPSLDKFLGNVKKDGMVLVNSSVVHGNLDTGGRTLIEVPVEDLALEKLGNPKVANTIILGAYLRASGMLDRELVKKAISEKFSRKGQKIVDLNYKALEIGYEAAEQCLQAKGKTCVVK